jgi:hypothetical protein
MKKIYTPIELHLQSGAKHTSRLGLSRAVQKHTWQAAAA